MPKVTQSEKIESYEITIKRTVRYTVKKQVRDVIDKRPYTHEEINNTSMFDGGEWKKTELKEVLGWTDPVIDEETKTEEVYRQCVDTLDLVSVVNAVNKQSG